MGGENVGDGVMAGDQTEAAALHLAKAHLEKMGWKYGPQDIGKTAREILSALEPEAADSRPPNCAERLREEGKPYPRSTCTACIVRKFGQGCFYTRTERNPGHEG